MLSELSFGRPRHSFPHRPDRRVSVLSLVSRALLMTVTVSVVGGVQGKEIHSFHSFKSSVFRAARVAGAMLGARDTKMSQVYNH